LILRNIFFLRSPATHGRESFFALCSDPDRLRSPPLDLINTPRVERIESPLCSEFSTVRDKVFPISSIPPGFHSPSRQFIRENLCHAHSFVLSLFFSYTSLLLKRFFRPFFVTELPRRYLLNFPLVYPEASSQYSPDFFPLSGDEFSPFPYNFSTPLFVSFFPGSVLSKIHILNSPFANFPPRGSSAT